MLKLNNKKRVTRTPKKLWAGFIIGIMTLSLVVPFMSAPRAEAATVSCWLTPRANRTIVRFDGTEIWASSTLDKARSFSTNSFSIPVGKYDITLLSYDYHEGKPTQTNESWYVKLKNTHGTVVTSTPAINDLPNYKNYLTQKVATSFLIPQVITSAIAFHAAYPSDKVNSITPVCAAFDKIPDPVDPDLTIAKSVRNLTSGSAWQKSVPASPGDTVQFSVKISSTGTTVAKNVQVKDNLPYKLSYLGTTSGATTSDITSGWVGIGNINPGVSKTIYFNAKVADESYFSVGLNTLTNTAKTYANNVATIEDTADVIVEREEETTPNITITKLGRNITKGYSSWVETVSAEPGDEIEFSIKVESTGDATAENINVRDYLPNKLSYISGSTNGATTHDITSGWINIGNIAAGSSKTIYLKAKLYDEDYFSVGTTTLTNIAKTYADDIWTIEDTATVLVDKDDDPIENDPNLSIEKLVRSLTNGYSSWQDSVYAEPGDEIEFSIKVESTGSTTAHNVNVRDYLPSKLSYVSGSTSGATTSDITSGWKAIGDIPVGSSRTIYFTARVFGETYFSTTTSETLINEAKTYADNVTTREDTARVFVQKEEANGTTKLAISKLGRNLTTGQLSLTDYVLAAPTNTIEFSIQVSNIGTETITNIKLWDVLPENFTYIDDTSYLNGLKVGDGITGAGVLIGDLSQGQSKTVKFQAVIATSNSFVFGGTVLTNRGYARANNIPDISDTALITVTRGKVLGATTIETGPTETLILSLIISLLASLIAYFVIKNKAQFKLRFIMAQERIRN